jgi:hypothetical protein
MEDYYGRRANLWRGDFFMHMLFYVKRGEIYLDILIFFLFSITYIHVISIFPSFIYCTSNVRASDFL